jgi:hypothetical protein
MPAVRLASLLRATTAVAFLIALSHTVAAQQALAVTNTAPLAFGRFAAGTGGSVIISSGGVRTASGGVVLLASGAGSAAQFTLTGEPGKIYSIDLPSAGSVVLTSGAGHTMPIQSFSSNPNGSGQLGAGGSQTVTVGATLGVAANQPVGSYSGSFQVLVNYN